MSSRGEIVRLVAGRAGGRCEYCRMDQSLQGATFHVVHIVPISLGGVSDLENLAWCSPGCNLHKSNRIEAPDPDTGELVPLVNPRQNSWPEHFRWESYLLVGQSAVGRATVRLLDLNQPRRLLFRQAEERFGLFPP
jgi:hypothetical protein